MGRRMVIGSQHPFMFINFGPEHLSDIFRQFLYNMNSKPILFLRIYNMNSLILTYK